MPEGAVSRSIGSAWLAAGASALLVVPSVIVEEESNVLLNPSHPDARRIFAVKTRRFLFDPRV
jgi:RES domain-containing protein